jgi:UDP:flavonoid glycosyltransferase YjiC (YdhE family)
MPSIRANKPVFFFLSAGWGPVVRTLPIAHRLIEHGIASAFAIGGTIGPKIRAAGFDSIELDLPEVDARADAATGWWSPYHFLALHGLENLTPLLDQVEAYRRAIAAGRPALVVTDINPVAALAARSLRVPLLTISQSIFLPFRKPASIASRKEVPDGMPNALPAINEVLARYGVDPVETAGHLEVGDATCVPSIPEFDPMQGVPSSLHYVGPILGNQLVPLSSADRPATANAVPEIFFYPGRPQDSAGPSGQTLLNVGLAALSGLHATVTVATGGNDFSIPEYRGPRLEIVPWRVISPDYRPSLIVHHGGHGACLTAMSAGIPSVVVPTHAEREYNARNLAALGCGEFVPTDRIAVHDVRSAIENVIAKPAYARECAKWSETIAARRYGGAGLIARIIMGMI